MGQISKTIQVLVTAGLSTGVMVLAVGCADTAAPTQANSNGIRGDVTDVRPMATATPASYQPAPYDNTGLIPTAPQPVTNAEPVATATSAAGESPAPLMSMTPAGKLGEKTHTVRKGETLYSIAKTSLGSGKLWKKIVAANPGVSAAKLKVGQVLTIPS